MEDVAGTHLHPLRFRPVYKDYLWGGIRLREVYGRRLPGPVIAESWEIADRPEGMSRVADGPFAGRTLDRLVADLGVDLVGTEAPAGRFPLLFKIIDARERLSVQVHPDERTASLTGGDAKTEMWVVLPGSSPSGVHVGLAPGVNRATFARARRTGAWDGVIQHLPAALGDAILVPGGQVHAIEAGCFLYEIQQNSDTTFRVWDWGRVGPDGRARELHLDQAMAAIAWEERAGGRLAPHTLETTPSGRRELLHAGHPFRVERLVLAGTWEGATDGTSFHVLFVARGRARAGDVELPPGSSCLIPAGLGPYPLASVGEEGAEILITALG